MTRTVVAYSSADASAPVLTGTAGDMDNLLRKCLIDGYGSKSAAGWTRPYSATNISVFRNDTTDGTGTYYRLKDDYTSTNQKFSALRMYETMSDVNTGTNGWYTVDDYTGVQKSNTQDATARAWRVVADNCAAHIFIQHGASGTDWEWSFIGDMFSFKNSDAYRGTIVTRNASGVITGSSYSSATYQQNRLVGAGEVGIGMVRNHTGTGTAVQGGLHTDGHKANASGSSSATWFGGAGFSMLAYPNAVNSGVLIAPIWIHQVTTSPYIIRGYLPGIWCPLHNRAITNNDTFSGSGSLAGKTFEVLNLYSLCQIAVETSNTWS